LLCYKQNEGESPWDLVSYLHGASGPLVCERNYPAPGFIKYNF